MSEPKAAADKPAQGAARRVADVLATVLGIGLFLAGIAALVGAFPIGSALMLFIAGAVALPFVPVRGRFTRSMVIVLAFTVALATARWKSFVVEWQVQRAFVFAFDAAARLTPVTRGGKWPAAADFPDQLDLGHGDGYSRDLMVKDCRGASCTLIVTLTDHDYDTSIRSRRFALWTRDGGMTWECGPTKLYPLAPKDLPGICQPTGAH